MGRKIKNLIKSCIGKLGLLDIYRLIRENLALFKVIVCCINYRKQLRRLRRMPKNEKIRVLFIVSEIAKWKEQKLYEAMEASGAFEPVVGISAWNRQLEHRCSNEKLLDIHNEAEAFFDKLGDRHVRTVIVENGKRVHLDLKIFKPDIVFYTEPWGPCEKQDPYTVSEFALTFFASYYVGDYCQLDLDCHLLVQRLVYGYFCLNGTMCKEYAKSLRFVVHSTRFIPTGHPGLDFFRGKCICAKKKGYVIYAPHFSFPNPNVPDFGERLSTFDWDGHEILKYAESHREMNWVFKPHPILKEWILDSGFMDQRGLSDYFSRWAEIGLVCEDGDYQELFLQSRVMITDSGSFLTEYGATGNPIIHLICNENKMRPIAAVKPVWDTYYQVHDLVSMYSTFRAVLEEGRDPNHEKRLAAVRAAGLTGCDASANIINYLSGVFSRV